MAVETDRRAMLIALTGAAVISFSPIFYIYSNTNPATGAFFRMVYALPVLALLAYFVRKSDTRSSRTRWMAVGAGLLLGPDMVAYHISVSYTHLTLPTICSV